MSLVLHDIYRPKTFAEVVGQRDAVQALIQVLKSKASHAFLFSSTSPGVGKTTMARITAKRAGCLDIMELSAAVLTGVDDMRKVQDHMVNRSFQGDGQRAVILDECARLSKQAWDSLLKIIEEAPDHAFFFFCTTDVGKVPATIRSRCTHITLGPLPDQDIEALLQRVIKREMRKGLELPADVLEVVTRSAHGSARQALVNLATCEGITDPKVAAKLTQGVHEQEPVLELCRFLLKGGSWGKAMTLVDKLETEQFEGIRLGVCNYLAKVLKGTKDEKQVMFLLRALEAFETPFNPSEGPAPLLLAIGSVLYGKG